MKKVILGFTIYLPQNLWILFKKLTTKKTKSTYHTDSFYFIPKKKVVQTEKQVKVKGMYLPERKTDGAAAFDLKAVIPEQRLIFRAGEVHLVPTSIHIEIPHGKCGLLIMRSGLASSTTLTLANGVGLIDSDYRGEILVPIRNTSMTKRASINNGDRIAQLLLVDCFTPTLVQAKVLSDTKRNTSGFGSTGVK